MSPVLQSVQFFLLAGIAFLVVGTFASAALAAAVGRSIENLDPATRYRALVLAAWLPLLIAFALLVSASLPSLIALVMPERDHCLTHDDDHAHLCFVHLPNLPIQLPVVLICTFLISYALVRLVWSAAALVRATRLLRVLVNTGELRADLAATLLETRAPICVTAGMLRPAVLISRGLLDVLSESERAIVLAHEREHVRRKDALVANLARFCSALHLPPIRRFILREIEIAAEQACDEAAGRAVGDRLAVAAAILTVERVTQRAGLQGLGLIAVGAGTAAVERRVRALVAEPLVSASLRPLYFGLGLTAAAVFATADHLHHATEAFLSLLVR